MLEKLEKLGDTETAKMIIGKWNEFSKIAGTNALISPLMDAVVRKEQIEKTTTAILNKSITQAEKEPTIESLLQAKTDLTASVKNMNKDVAALYGKRIDAAENRLKEKTKREEDLETKKAEEGRSKQAEIEKEGRESGFAKMEGEVFAKWIEGKTPLSKREQMIIDRKLRETGQTPEKAKALVKARMKAKIESYTEELGRPPTKQELRALYISDPWGFLEDGDGGGDKLEGMEPGIYRVDGAEVKWDGTKRIE